MSNTSSITNKLTNKLCLTSGGKCNTTDTIYAAECMKHNLIYVGHSSQKLSGRFNGHCSDVKVKPEACKLSQHFHKSKNCKTEKDAKVYILQDNARHSGEERHSGEKRHSGEERVHGGPLDYQIKYKVTKWHELKPKGFC